MKKFLVILLLLVTVTTAWMLRYQYVTVKLTHQNLRVNRFTGTTCTLTRAPDPKWVAPKSLSDAEIRAKGLDPEIMRLLNTPSFEPRAPLVWLWTDCY